MKTEIDELHYCAGGLNDTDHPGYCEYIVDDSYGAKAPYDCTKEDCPAYRSKWETPAQYEKRTRQAWSDDAAVYAITSIAPFRWMITNYGEVKLWEDMRQPELACVCANSDWGIPPDGWMPEE